MKRAKKVVQYSYWARGLFVYKNSSNSVSTKDCIFSQNKLSQILVDGAAVLCNIWLNLPQGYYANSFFTDSSPANSLRSAGATRVPINSIARISLSCDNEPGFI